MEKESNNTEIDNLEIKTYSNIKENIYKIYSPEYINEKIKKLSFDKELLISGLKEKDGYTIIVLHKIDSCNDKNIINYTSLKIEIIKNLSNKNTKTNIEIKKEKVLKREEFESLKFLHYDIFKINEKMSFLFIFLFNEFYLYKINENSEENILNYNQLKFEFNKYKKYLYLGNNIDDNNILEYIFLSKPKNVFIYFIFNLSSLINKDDIEYNIEERNITINDNQKVMLKKFNRGINLDKYLFIEENYYLLIHKDTNNKNNMLLSLFEIYYKNDLYIKKIKNPFLLKICEKTFMIIDFSKNKDIENKEKKLILGIFEIYFNKGKNKYTTQLLQEIYININPENYNISLISNKALMIINNNTIYYIKFNNNCLVEKIHQFKLNSRLIKEFQMDSNIEYNNYYIYEDDKNIRISSSNTKYEIYYFTLNKPDIKVYKSFLNSLLKDKLDNLTMDNYKSLNKQYNSIQKKLNEQSIQLEKNEKMIEDIAQSVIKATTIQDDKNNEIENNDDKTVISNKSQMNYQSFTPEKLSFINQMKQTINLNQINNQINQINQYNQIKQNNQQINPLGVLDPRINQINSFNIYQKINQLNQLNNNNIQNQNNVNLLSNLMNNRLQNSQISYNNINPNILQFQ